MRPASMTEEQNEKVWQSSEFYTTAHFRSEYSKFVTAQQHVAECAKIFIRKNWEKVTDWTGLNVVIEAKQGTVEFYNYKPEKRARRIRKDPPPDGVKRARGVSSPVIDKMMREIDAEEKAKHNPIVTITKVVLDPTDGDFSLTVNGQELWWINDEAVIEIAHFIEQKLKSEVKEEATKAGI